MLPPTPLPLTAPPPPLPFRWTAARLRALSEGDPELMARLRQLVRRDLARRSRTLQHAWDDIDQDVVASLIGAIRQGRIKDPRAFPGYARVTLRNRIADWARGHARFVPLESQPGWERAPEARAQELALRVDLQRALGELTLRQRRVLQALYLEGQTYQAAADSLGLPLGTLKRVQTAGLKELRRSLSGPPEILPEA